MQTKLEFIVGKIDVCVRSKNWSLLPNWSHLLHCWLSLRYPIPVPTRAKLVRLFYELALLPGIEPRLIRSWIDDLSRVLANKGDAPRKVEPEDLQLPWEPLWRVLQKELWPKKRAYESSRNSVNILLYLAEQVKVYFPPSEIPAMLEAFLPLVTQSSILIMIPVMTSFLPPFDIHLYIPVLFKLWEAFNSEVINARLIEFFGDLSEEHKTGSAVKWKDVGIWTDAEWTVLVGKALGSMNVPVGATKGSSTTASQADLLGEKLASRIKKNVNRYRSLARLFVYSMAVDSPTRNDMTETPGSSQPGYLAGSKALDSLDKLFTSTESFFHPSNSGPWSMFLTTFLQAVASEFCKRWKDEELPGCETPPMYRLTPAIKRSFVISVRTPALLSMFSKDPISMAFAQGALKSIALLEPNLVMPDIIERAYSGLEVVNETHRTTAVLSTLSGVAIPLVSERIWFGGQRHVLPLLELSLPGIDLNDPTKTVCATMFITAIVQAGIKIGDLTRHVGLALASDAPGDEMMAVDKEDITIPEGTEPGWPALGREEERALVRDSTAGFADWVVSLFRRVFSLFENLPEEGGKRNTVPKQEELVLKSVKAMLDIVCLHLSDQLFDLVLKIVFDYATTNARSNSVRAVGQLVSCLARVKPGKTVDKFLPHCAAQIQEELKHGASSLRTTSNHSAVPSDTTLHWNLSILRACLGYGSDSLITHKQSLLDLFNLLIEKTKSKRGYSTSGGILSHLLSTLTGTYPLDTRFVNSEEWDSPGFDANHHLHWGRMYNAKDVKIEWHVPSREEIDFILEVLNVVGNPVLDKIDQLLDNGNTWDSIARNDFCRYMRAIRSIWGGLACFMRERPKVPESTFSYNFEVDGLLLSNISVKSGFALDDPEDPRYKAAEAHRVRFGEVIHRATKTTAMRNTVEGEDHVDAIISIAKAAEVFLLEYGTSRGQYSTQRKVYTQLRDMYRMSPRQKERSRMALLKRAHLYHYSRMYLNAMYRQRSPLDDKLIHDLVELSLSQYTRLRRYCQSIVRSVSERYVRSTRSLLPALCDSLIVGTDPDRMKGALYMLWDNAFANYALADVHISNQYLTRLLDCQHQEKPSIQKLVSDCASECLAHLSDEAVHSEAYREDIPGVLAALDDLEKVFGDSLVDKALLKEALEKVDARFAAETGKHERNLESVLAVASRPTTHWRYQQFATRILYSLLQRDMVPTPELARFFLEQCTSPHTATRAIAVRGIIKLTVQIKMRTYSASPEELWLDEWHSPIERRTIVSNPTAIRDEMVDQTSNLYVDKVTSGFLLWQPQLKAYLKVPEGDSPITWEHASKAVLEILGSLLDSGEIYSQLVTLWAQESSQSEGKPDLRNDHVQFIKSLAKTFEDRHLDTILNSIDSLLTDPDRFKQRAGAEVLVGLLRGSKHWPKQKWDKLWTWTLDRIDQIFLQIKPDTLSFWKSVFSSQLDDRDPRRSNPLIQWTLNLPIDFQGDSAFTMNKTLSLFGVVLDNITPRSAPLANQFFRVLLDNANTGYNEMRNHIASSLYIIISAQWNPTYSSVAELLHACVTDPDPLQIRSARYLENAVAMVQRLPEWKEQRLPPPRTNQSQYDKVGLTLLLWMWTMSHGPMAPLMFKYIKPMLPEILKMSELNDSSELQIYASAVLYVLSAVTPPHEYVEDILGHFVNAIKSSTSWRIRLNALPTLVVFFYRNLLSISNSGVTQVMEVLLDCLGDENVEVREMASKALSGIVRCSQRQSIIPLKNRFIGLVRKARLPSRQDAGYAEKLRLLHSGILGLCALIESFPYSVEPWMPPLTDVLAAHTTDPPPISTTIKKCASEFKKTHQDTWVKDQLLFDEDQLQNLSTMLVGTSYYA
ncbi:ARM repeat-containing protein [Thelephora ganbajun]|uniref:ARM repeat-containing protein n=1 Tax=Thelephora ganbajun TaxID=370292 RepID=A0ACB6ZG23_THEGA|nr:ARM repeat-containing protein [Thelephora ganbajun]